MRSTNTVSQDVKVPVHDRTLRTLSLLRAFQTIDTEFPIQYAICFLEISLQEGISLTTLSKRTGMAMSTTSRIIGALSNNRQKGKAFALVYAEISPQERRKKEIYLTERGHQLIKDMSNLYA